MPHTFRINSSEHIGQRDNQEDFHLIQTDLSQGGQDAVEGAAWTLSVVCDGMGGHAAGEVASTQSCVFFVKHFLERMEERGDIKLALYDCLEIANKRLADILERSPSSHGMGCTLLATVTNGDELHWVSVGDSLLFIVREGEISQLNADHSYFSILLEKVHSGELTLEQARLDPRKNRLLAAVMGEELFMVDLPSEAFTLHPGDHLLLASDGIETLDNQNILEIVQNADTSESSDISALVVEQVLSCEKRNQDNVTVVHLEVVGP